MSIFLWTQFASSFKCKSIFIMNGKKMAVVILNNRHTMICNFFNPEGNFKVWKQLCLFLTSLVIFTISPGNYLTRSRIIFWVPGCCHSNTDVTVGVTASLLLFSSLHKFHRNTRFISRTPRKHLLPRSWVRFRLVKFTFNLLKHRRYHCATGVRWITDWSGNNQREVWSGHTMSLIYHASY